MDLPQEIIDEVIDNLVYDFRTLKSISLVRKSWTHRSRRRLFYFIQIDSLGRLEQWSTIISADPQGIASYPRVITLVSSSKSWLEPANLAKFYDHFRSFSRVGHLTISGLEAAKFDATSIVRYFGNFAATVRSLELRTAVGTPASLLSFICAFPLVDNLAIKYPNPAAGGGNQGEVTLPMPAPSFKGELRLLDMFHESDPLVELLCALPLSFHTISVSSRETQRLPQLSKLVSKCGKTLRSLYITRMTSVSPGPTGASLASCAALEVLRITAGHPKHLVAILGEILPTLSKTANLSRIVLDADGSYPGEVDTDVSTWSNLDAVMSGYAEGVSTKDPSRRMVLQFRTDGEGATGEHDGWVRELVSLLVLFPKVGDVVYVSKH